MKNENENGGGEMEKVVKLTVMITESQAERLSICQQKTGANTSEIVRFSIDNSIPLASAYPSLIHIIPTIPANIHRKTA